MKKVSVNMTPNTDWVNTLLEKMDKETKRLFFKQLSKELTDLPDFDKTRKTILDNQENDCPHCHSTNIIGHGTKYKGRRRYKCKDCKKTFNEQTGTSIHNLKKKDLFPQYLDLMLDGLSIRKIAMKLKISTRTSFNWRHKVLSSFKNLDKGKFRGILEIDDKQYYFSEKGRKDLTRKPYKRPTDRDQKCGNSDTRLVTVRSVDRNDNMDIKIVKFGRLTTETLSKYMKGKLSKNTVICSDGHHTYQNFCKKNNLKHHVFITSKGQHVKDRMYHVQHINSMDNRLKKFLEKFYGVSTKYLQNYLNWFVMIDSIKKSKDKVCDYMNVVLKSNQSWKTFTNREEDYQDLMLKIKV